MFHIYQSHSLQKLASTFKNKFEPVQLNPLSPSWIIVQNNEVKEWLSLALAQQNGIAANLRFIFPSEFLWTLYRLKKEDLPTSLPSDLQAMQWALFKLISTNHSLLESVPSYDLDNDDEMKRFQFAAQLADNFDQYQVYRPEMMEHWLDRKLVTKQRDEKWQLSVWNRLNTQWEENNVSREIPRRSQAFAELLTWLEGDTELRSKIPENIYVFGLSHAPAPFLKIISQLAKHKNIHYYRRKSAVDNQPDKVSALFKSWRKPEAQLALLLQDTLEIDRVEYDETKLEAGSKPFPKLKIHSCHNRRREVQVLKDELLHFLDANPGCNTEDCLIMVPDSEAYSGTLEVVFENSEGEPAIPLSRLSRKNQATFEHTLAELLRLLSGTFKASAVLNFLTLETVRARFLLSEADIHILEQWVLENKIHWGIGDSVDTPFSWEKGVSQLMAGFAMETEELAVYQGMIPFLGINSTDDAALVAQFHRFLALLKRAAGAARESHTPKDWLHLVEQWVHEFMEEALNESSAKSGLLKQLHRLKEQIAFSDFSEKLPFKLIRNWLLGQLENQVSNSGRFGQGVTVSSYIPYRAVPFQFIAVLGMNEGIFPRKAIRPSYDLIYADPQPGDRILKEDDTYLFLETIQAAEKQLHLSYQGQDQRSDAYKLPSILLQQLIDALFDDPKEGIQPHQLHPFSKRNYDGSVARSFSKANLELLKALKASSTDEVIEHFISSKWKGGQQGERKEPLHISQLIRFFTHPSKYFVQNELDVKNYEEFNEMKDREQFKLQGLDRYAMDDFLFDALVNKRDSAQIFSYSKAAGMLPESVQGEKVFNEEKESIEELLKKLELEADETEQKTAIEADFFDTEIIGEIAGIFGQRLISYRVGARRAKHEINHWVKHLLLLNAGVKISESVYISNDKGEIELARFPTVKITENPLSGYMKWVLKDRKVPDKLAFFPESSRAYAEEFLKSGRADKARTKAKAKWEGSRFSSFAESNDFYHQLIWRSSDPIASQAFHELAMLFWEPLLTTMEED